MRLSAAPYTDGIQSQSDVSKAIPVILVFGAICFLYMQYVFLHGFRILQVDLPDSQRDAALVQRGIVELTWFHLLTGLVIYCFLRCMFTFPGAVPDNKGWELSNDERDSIPAQEKKWTGERRHCKWCLKYKPDRTHHCRICQVCVLRMDHHCPWVQNCIGFRNHKYFFLLIVYSAADLLYTAITMFDSAWWSTRTDVSIGTMFFLTFAECFACFLAVITCLFLGFHSWLTLKAMTTLEFCEKSMKQADYDASAYSKGAYSNICSVLGPNPVFWLLPLRLPQGDGMTFT